MKNKNFKNLKKKLKKTNKKYRYTFYTAFLTYLISVVFISSGLLLLSGIETFIRYVIIFTFIIGVFLYFFSSLVFLITKKHIWLIVTTIIVLILSIINIAGYYYISKTYGYIDRINKNTILYTTNLIALKDTQLVINVGMISEEKDVEGYILPKEYLKLSKNSYKIEYYDDYFTLLNDLYDKKIEGVFISSNYSLLYNNIERFENISADTKVIAKHSKEMENQDSVEATNKSVTEPFTVLIMGVDSQYDGLSKNAAFNGDTLMLLTFNPKTLTSTVFSIPRDTYVPIACNNNRSNKINSAAAYGSKCMINTIEGLTGITVDYSIKINFKGVVSLVDALGGVQVVVPEPDFASEYCLEDSNRIYKNVCLTPGNQLLDGEHALALSRVRKAFLLGDFKRVQNQQLVVEAIAKKAKSIRNINDFYNVLNAISNNLDTNMSTKEMLNFYNVGKNLLFKNHFKDNEFISIQKTYLSGYDLTLYLGGINTYTFQYYEESLNEIVKAMKINLELEKAENIKTFNFSVNEIYEEQIIGKDFSSTKRNETLPNFVGNSYNYLQEWNSTRNLSISKTIQESNICINNEILSQNVHSGTLISSINSLTVTVCQNIVNETYSNTSTSESENIDNNEPEIRNEIFNP